MGAWVRGADGAQVEVGSGAGLIPMGGGEDWWCYSVRMGCRCSRVNWAFQLFRGQCTGGGHGHDNGSSRRIAVIFRGLHCEWDRQL